MAFLDRDFIACLKCTQDCFNWHAGHVARPDIAPSFVSQVHRHDGLQKIPRRFSGSFLGKCSGKVTLEGPSGRERHVELKKDKDIMILSDPGWSDFVKYHGLLSGDGVLFTFLGRGIFKVRIFDMKGQEKGRHCYLSIPTVDTCTSKIYHINQEQNPPQNSSSHLIDPHFYYGPPHQAIILHHNQNLDNALPEKASMDNDDRQYDQSMEFYACDEETLTIANHYQSALNEENIAHHEDHGQPEHSIECNLKCKELDGKHSPALDSFDASHDHRNGVSNAHEICDLREVCNEERLEIYNDDDALIKSINSCNGKAFNGADCVDGGNAARTCAKCEGETQMMSNVHNNEKLYMHVDLDSCQCCDSAIALDGHDDKEDLMNDDKEDLMHSKYHDDKEQMMNIEHESCQCCDSGLAIDGLGQEVAQKETYVGELMQEERCIVVETGRQFSRADTTNQQAAQAESICGCNSHKQDVFSHFSQRRTRGRALTERPNVPETERQHLICEANAFRSQFPIARKSLKPSYAHKMVFPKIFVQNFMPKKNVNITLTDPYGKDWPCKWLGAFRGSNNFMPCISAGWSQFAHAHQLKTHDILVFELTDTTALHFKVHFFKPKAFDVLSQPPDLLSTTPYKLESKNYFKMCE